MRIANGGCRKSINRVGSVFGLARFCAEVLQVGYVMGVAENP